MSVFLYMNDWSVCYKFTFTFMIHSYVSYTENRRNSQAKPQNIHYFQPPISQFARMNRALLLFSYCLLSFLLFAIQMVHFIAQNVVVVDMPDESNDNFDVRLLKLNEIHDDHNRLFPPPEATENLFSMETQRSENSDYRDNRLISDRILSQLHYKPGKRKNTQLILLADGDAKNFPPSPMLGSGEFHKQKCLVG